MRVPYVRVSDVVGYTYNDGAYCLDCADVSGISRWAAVDPVEWSYNAPVPYRDQPAPVFVSDLSDGELLHCDCCRDLVEC